MADGGQPSSWRSHELDAVYGPGPRRPYLKVCPVEPVEGTAGYDEYVRRCGRTGAERAPPTRWPEIAVGRQLSTIDTLTTSNSSGLTPKMGTTSVLSEVAVSGVIMIPVEPPEVVPSVA